MAERFNQKVNIQPVDTGTGAAQASMSLVNKLEDFKNFAFRTAGTLAEEKAKQRGILRAQQVKIGKTDGVTKAPEFEEQRFVGGVEIEAYNKTLRNAYLASLDNDNRENIARIASENTDNLIGFNEAAEAYKKGVVKTVDPSVRLAVLSDIDNKITDHRVKVQAANIKKDKDNAEAEVEFSAKSLLDESAVYAREGNILKSAKKLQDVFAVYTGQFDSGTINKSDFALKKRKAELLVTKEAIVGGIKRNMQDGKFKEAIESLIKFREKTPKGMTIPEHDEVTEAIKTEINETILLNNKLEDSDKAKVVKGQNLNYANLFTNITLGTANSQDVLEDLNNRKITTEQASKLINTINTRGTGVDDWALISSIQEDIRNGEDVRNAVIGNTGTLLTEKTAATLLQDYNEFQNEESLLKTNTVKRAESYIIQSLKVTGPFGALDVESEKRLAKARREFSERVLSGEGEWDVADELVGKNEFETSMNPKYGSKENLSDALTQLNEAAATGIIDKDTYNFEYQNIQRLKQLKENITAFDKAKKEAENANKRQ